MYTKLITLTLITTLLATPVKEQIPLDLEGLKIDALDLDNVFSLAELGDSPSGDREITLERAETDDIDFLFNTIEEIEEDDDEPKPRQNTDEGSNSESSGGDGGSEMSSGGGSEMSSGGSSESGSTKSESTGDEGEGNYEEPNYDDEPEESEEEDKHHGKGPAYKHKKRE